MNKAELLRKIMNLSFVLTELELFLDTHPESRTALEYYHTTAEELRMATEEYEGKYGPITARGSSQERWNWVDSPWPWHNYTENNTLGCRGNRRD